MLRRARLVGAAVLACLVGLATLSYTPGVTLHVAGIDGLPAGDAYVRYHYTGSLINPVHPVSYVARGSVIGRADADGRVTIPGRLHVRRPFPVSTPPRLFIDFVYVPRLHTAFGPIAAMTMPRPGVFAIDDDGRRIAVHDVSHDPDLWERSLRELFENIRGTAGPGSQSPAVAGDHDTRSQARELAAHLRREYADFIATHGQTRRQRPKDPPPHATSEEDRRAWRERVDADLASQPHWGPLVQRTWRSNLAELDAIEADLK